MVKRDSDKIRMNQMAEVMADRNTCDFFTESRKLKGQNNNLSNASNDIEKNMMNYICILYCIIQ